MEESTERHPLRGEVINGVQQNRLDHALGWIRTMVTVALNLEVVQVPMETQQ